MNQIKTGVILNYINILLTFAVGLIYTPYLINSLGQSNYGVYAFAMSLAGYLTLLDMGIGNSIVRYVSANIASGSKEVEKKIIGFFIKIFTFIGIITLFIGFFIVKSVDKFISNDFTAAQTTDLKIILAILTTNFALGFIFTTFSAVIQAYEKYIFLKLSNVLRTFLIPVLSVVTLIIEPNVVYLVITLFIVNISVFIVHWYYFKFKLKLCFNFNKVDKNLKVEIFKYSSVIFIVAIADKIYWQTDQVLLGILKSPKDVALFAVSYQFITIFLSLSMAINGMFLPKITKILNDKSSSHNLNGIFVKVSSLQAIIVGFAFSGFVVFGEEFIYLWVGKEYELVYYITLILITPFFIDLIQNLGITIMQAKNKYSFRAYVLIICSILNVVISIPIIMKYSGVGTAVVTSIFILIGNVIIMNVYFHKKLHLNMFNYWKNILPIVIVLVVYSAIGLFIKMFINIGSWISLFAVIAVYTSIFFTGFYWIYKYNFKEKNRI